MDFWKAILGLARRKLIIIPLLVFAIGAGLAGYFLTPLHYVSSTTMVLITPAQGGTLSQDPTAPIDLTNPMLNFSNNLKTASSILIQVINTPEVTAELGAVKGGPTKLTVDDGRTNPQLLDANGPFIYVAADSTSAAEAKDVVIRAQERMRQELVDRQKSLGAPPETYLTMVDVIAPTTPEVTRSTRIKIASVALAASLILGLSVAYAWQSLRYGRHRLAEGSKLSPTVQHIDLDSGLDRDRYNDLDAAAHKWAAEEVDVKTDVTSTAVHYPMDESERDVDYAVTAQAQPAVDDQLEIEQQMADGELEATDSKDAPDWGRLAELEAVSYMSEEAQTTEFWDLYIVESPATQAGIEHMSEQRQLDWALDWNLDCIEPERARPSLGQATSADVARQHRRTA